MTHEYIKSEYRTYYDTKTIRKDEGYRRSELMAFVPGFGQKCKAEYNDEALEQIAFAIVRTAVEDYEDAIVGMADAYAQGEKVSEAIYCRFIDALSFLTGDDDDSVILQITTSGTRDRILQIANKQAAEKIKNLFEVTASLDDLVAAVRPEHHHKRRPKYILPGYESDPKDKTFTKFSPDDVREMRKMHKEGVGLTPIANHFHTRRSEVYAIIIGRTYAWVH